MSAGSPRRASPARASNVAELRERLAGFRTQESMDAALAFEPRANDVFIATYSKSGTTWMQQIVHTLRTGGDMNFTEITAVVPWLESARDLGLDVHAEQRAAPRAYKTHFTRRQVPKGGRYIWVVRDPADVLVSFYHFFAGWFFDPRSLSMENFALEFFLDGSLAGSYWAHLIGWWEASVGEDVLALSFEGMQQDPERTIERVARFAGLPLSESLKAVTLRHSSIEFMREHAGQFDDHLVRNARDAACGIPTGGTSAKVRAGKVGTGRGALSAQIRDALDDRWRDEVLPQTGLSDYGAMRMYLDAGPASRTGARVG